MSMINTNVNALRAQSAGSMASKDLGTTMERLSTGKRINSAKDDAAGLAISQRMTSNIRGTAVAIRNANDGISLAQTAEGSLNEVTNMLQRVRELAVQSANGTLSGSNRTSLQSETDQLLAEINNIAKTANFNGLNLLDGSVKNLSLQTGVNASDKVSVSLVEVNTNSLGLTAGGRDGQTISGRVGDLSSIASGDVTINGASAVATDFASGITVDTAKVLAEAINANSAQTGVTATASNNVTSAKPTAETFAAGDLVINDVAIAASANVNELVSNINRADTGVLATLNKDGTITLANSGGKDIKIASTNADDGFTSATNTGFVSLQSNDGKDIKIGGTTADINNFGFNASTDGVSFTGADVTQNVALNAGDVIINGISIGAALADNTNAATQAGLYIDAINAETDRTGVKAVASDSGDGVSLVSTTGGAVRVEGPGLSKVGLVAQGGSDKFTTKLDISSQEAATSALSVIDAALESVTTSRGELGSVQNRLESTVNNLTNTTNNLSAARSRIEDADFAAETTQLAKSQILTQAAQAMLAQANQSQQGVLSLLR
ncbi:flagellin protein FlaA [Pacificimonas sp. WHA3]|uniref:Flagellin n=1 Tax=Pacificimonas pallii TaxID=2827236 RepID=A0ABS6SF56_9SPHN|nr:flagellin [Pacificimonas pallii]MBV7257005.1 flagellin protein FlaA [Pacificimonas pallii]